MIDRCVAKTTNSTITYLITESTRIIRILKHRCGSRWTAQPFNTLTTDPVGPWMYLCRFMIHRVIDCSTAKTTNSSITYLITESTHIIRIIKQANIVADPDEQHIHATPFLIIRCKHEYKCDNPCFVVWLIGVMLKTTHSTIYVWSALDLLVSSEKSNKETSLRFQMNSTTTQLLF